MVDPEEFYDFQVNRPTVSTTDEGMRRITWPSTQVYVARPPGSQRDVVLLRGIEPNMKWRQFCAELLGLRRRARRRASWSPSARCWPRPRTPGRSRSAAPRPSSTSRTGSSSSPRRTRARPASSACSRTRAPRLDVPAVSFWAAVPHYLPQPPCPKATLALLGQVEDLLETSIPLGDLPEDSRAWERGVAELAEEDEDVAEYVRNLEESQDAAELPEASGEAIAREFERYLKRRDDRGSAADVHDRRRELASSDAASTTAAARVDQRRGLTPSAGARGPRTGSVSPKSVALAQWSSRRRAVGASRSSASAASTSEHDSGGRSAGAASDGRAPLVEPGARRGRRRPRPSPSRCGSGAPSSASRITIGSSAVLAQLRDEHQVALGLRHLLAVEADHAGVHVGPGERRRPGRRPAPREALISWCGKTRSLPPPWTSIAGAEVVPARSRSTRCASPGRPRPSGGVPGRLAGPLGLPEQAVERVLLAGPVGVAAALGEQRAASARGSSRDTSPKARVARSPRSRGRRRTGRRDVVDAPASRSRSTMSTTSGIASTAPT